MVVSQITPNAGVQTIIIYTKDSDQSSFEKHSISKQIGTVVGTLTPALAFLGFVVGGSVGSRLPKEALILNSTVTGIAMGCCVGGALAIITSLFGVALQLTVDKGIDAALFVVKLPFKASAAVYSAISGSNKAPSIDVPS
jgi:hypothetical protein